MGNKMDDEFDVYLGRYLKNWSAKQHPASNLKKELLWKASNPSSEASSPFALFFSGLANRWSAPSEHFYSQSLGRFSGSYVQSVMWSNHFASQLRMVQ
jgi:hypothetical protein